MYRKTFVEVDREALRFNLAQYHKALPPGGLLMAVVKADGYGHGAVEVAKIASQAGVSWFGVASMEEALELRSQGVEGFILLLGPWDESCIPLFLPNQITPMVYHLTAAERLQAYGAKHQLRFSVHLKVDTGMARLGLNREQLNVFLAKPWPHLQVEGIASHLAQADSGNPKDSLTQIHRFWAINEGVDALFMPRWQHIANSAGTTEFAALDRGNLFRVGIGLYGQQPSKTLSTALKLKQALSFKTQVAQLQWFEPRTPLGYGQTFVTHRKTQVACLAVGYGDGYSRQLSNRGEVLVRGQRAKVLGRVCMDLTLVDVTDIEGVSLEDEVVLIGSQGDQEILAAELATLMGTINYEVCCAISKRVPRFYRN